MKSGRNQWVFKLVLEICVILLLVIKGGYAMQPPPPPLNLAQLKMLIEKADVIVVGQIDEVKETEEAEKTVEATLSIEKLLKGKVAGKTITIRETYKTYKPELVGHASRDEGATEKTIVKSIAGPRAYHGKYRQGERVLVLLEKIEARDRYRPLGSGTYNKHLCEFLIGDDGIKTYYFQFSDDVGKYRTNERQFLDLIKFLITSSLNKRSK
jgi:hypothetical protein